MKRWLTGIALVLSPALTCGTRLAAQASLAAAAEHARGAWLAHDPQALVGQSASIVLQIPGADPSSPLDRAQAAELLRRHWRTAVERSVTVRGVHESESGRGYAELERCYVVAGTSDERQETIFLGFRQVGTSWRLTELRSAP
ncbi:MAG: hypothetical protein AUH78_27830 [Gemmatimonadetes bacterium 13_1_40CM_4_69_8]|nr:MAG: hypothetical protein AUH78_27830 [Gemmatimonadetes bacterium 13_1_40CM_4_69_8]